MRAVSASIPLASILLNVAACGDDRPPAPTAEESDQLNEAEELLNAEAEAQENTQ